MKSGECVIPNPSRLVDQVIACAPQEWSTGTITGAVTGMLHRAVRHHLTYGECWSAIWPESDAEWLAVLNEWSQVFNEIDGRTLESIPEPQAEHPTAEAFKIPAVRQHYTENRYMVGSKGFTITIVKPPTSPMSCADAVNLAAWLVALADPTRELFDAVLDAALNT